MTTKTQTTEAEQAAPRAPKKPLLDRTAEMLDRLADKAVRTSKKSFSERIEHAGRIGELRTALLNLEKGFWGT